MNAATWYPLAMRTMVCPHCHGEGTCAVCNGKGWVVREWGDLWQAQRRQEPLVYMMDYCDMCGTVRPVVRLYGRWLCADCAAATASEAVRWAGLIRPLAAQMDYQWDMPTAVWP